MSNGISPRTLVISDNRKYFSHALKSRTDFTSDTGRRPTSLRRDMPRSIARATLRKIDAQSPRPNPYGAPEPPGAHAACKQSDDRGAPSSDHKSRNRGTDQNRVRSQKFCDCQHAVCHGDGTLQIADRARDGKALHLAARDQRLLATNDVVKISHACRYEISSSWSFLSSARLEEKSLDLVFARLRTQNARAIPIAR